MLQEIGKATTTGGCPGFGLDADIDDDICTV